METVPGTGRGAEESGFPPAPWSMTGQLWLSLFRVEEDVDALRTAGIYGAAFVSYEAGSELVYSELLVARPARSEGHRRRVEIVDIWVDSPASMAGGRELWAIPKQLCDFTVGTRDRGPLTSTSWSASVERRPIAHASFTDLSRGAPRAPFRGGTWQPALDPGGPPRTASLRGSARTLPCRGRWEFDPAGPLGWLAGRRRLASFRMAGFRMTFG